VSKIQIGSGQFLRVSQFLKILIKLIPKDYIADLTFSQEVTTETVGAAADVVFHCNAVNLISDANKKALKTH
jgi:hypothetical protein